MSLLPNEWIENSIEAYNYQHTTKSQAIYWVVLAAVTAALISLPFIYIDISVQGGGVIRPVTEKTEIKAAITELVDSVYVREGQQVNKGDILLRFRTSNPDYKITYQTNRLNDYEAHLADLTYLHAERYLQTSVLRCADKNTPTSPNGKTDGQAG